MAGQWMTTRSALRASDDQFNTEVRRAGRAPHEMLNGEFVLIDAYEYDATVWPIRGQCGYELD